MCVFLSVYVFSIIFVFVFVFIFFSRPTPIGGREIHIGLLREEGERREEGPLASSPGQGLASYQLFINYTRGRDPVTGP